MNFIFISPNFPTNYYHFCAELKKNGVNVLGIGDSPYEMLAPELKDALNEYYKVGSMENYDEMYRAVAFFAFKYGKIDWIESNNEYWLEQDAQLRTDFNVSTGFHTEDMVKSKYKSAMKAYYEKAGIPTARYHLCDTVENGKAFAKKVGWPVIVKPDNGVGASDTQKLYSDEDMEAFYQNKPADVQYIMEEFVRGVVCSYDAIINSKGEPIFETGNISYVSIMDIVNNNDNCFFSMTKNIADDVRAAGRACIKAFDVKARFVHWEFFRLTEDQEGVGKKGDILGLEVNMRPSGGVSPDMHNFANSTDVYKIWADMIVKDYTDMPEGQHYYVAFGSRRFGKQFVLSHEEVMEKYGHLIAMEGPVPEALSGAMGNYMYIGKFDEEQEMFDFINELFATVD